jgi:hypothetical protein
MRVRVLNPCLGLTPILEQRQGRGGHAGGVLHTQHLS